MIDCTKSYYALIDNKITDKEPVGYCYCDAHKGYISAAYCKSHNCLHKDKGHICTFFIQNKEHQYFIQQKRKKDDAALYKRLKSMYFENIIDCRTYKDIERRIQNRRRTKEDVNAILDRLCVLAEYVKSAKN